MCYKMGIKSFKIQQNKQKQGRNTILWMSTLSKAFQLVQAVEVGL